jgi:hypothetical protein
MSSYWDCRRPTTNCVHFIYRADVDETDVPLRMEFKSAHIEYIYVNYNEVLSSGKHIVNHIADLLGLANAPYRIPSLPGEIDVWVPFADDLITLSESMSGIVIVIDFADLLLAKDSRVFFALIQTFLSQVHHWQKRMKPCHLCFQMEKNDWVRRIFDTLGESTGSESTGSE